MVTTIKVRSRAGFVPDHKQLAAGRKAFVGWQFDASLGDLVEVEDEHGRKQKVRQTGWRRITDAVELDVSNPEFAVEYRKHLAWGDLEAADAATVAWANENGFAEKVGGKPVSLPTKPGPQPGSDSPKG